MLIRKKIGDKLDKILKKTCIFSSIYVDWSEGLLESSKMHVHFLRAVWIQEVNSMSHGKSEQLRPRSEAIKERSLRAPRPVATTP